MKADFRVCLDACVLANYGVTDLLLRLAERPRQFLPVWSEEILAEVRRTHVGRLDWPEHLADSFGSELRTHFPEAMVSGYEPFLGAMDNHPKDRHVLAAAVKAGAEIVLTFNLKDFPKEALDSWGVEAWHPQDYLLTLYEMDDLQVVSRIAAIAARRGKTQEDVLLALGRSLPTFAARLHGDLDLT